MAQSTVLEEDIYVQSQDMHYAEELPAQGTNYVRRFLKDRVGGQHPEVLARYTAVLQKRLLRRKKRSRNAKKRKLLTSREKRQLGLMHGPDPPPSYDTFLAVHRMWRDYAESLGGAQERLLKAEYTGCHLTVAASRCPSYVGVRGIVLQETKNVFRLLTAEGRVRTVPKAHSQFAFELAGKLHRIYGSHFRVHSFERVKAKFKAKGVVGL
ncbi:hypothetical protein HPB47_003399 [Ixodes persulcatus]|uniref:Uncharacterized protein n=1 Tax=Ixodes persulcatus TaxID=34615 RepID=A0AC60PJQ9_IXOPE|nr:hypothetical protein HPB47_003399 [Ixodes persulcatus]